MQKFRKNKLMNEKKRTIIIVIIIFVFIIGLIGIKIYINNSDSGDTLESIPTADKTLARVGEEIQFSSVNSKGNIVNYSWNFGDGKQNYDSNPIHIFKRTGWYNVSLNVTDNNGISKQGILRVGIQRNDIENNVIEGRLFKIYPFSNPRVHLEIEDIGPNIGNPSISGKLTINMVNGAFDFIVRIRWAENNEWRQDDIFRESYSTIGGGYDNTFNLQSDTIPLVVQSFPSGLDAFVEVTTGSLNNIEISAQIKYPMEEINLRN